MQSSSHVFLLLLVFLTITTQAIALPGSPVAPRLLPMRLGMFHAPKSTLLLRPDFRVLDPRVSNDRMGRTALLETQHNQEIRALMDQGLDRETGLKHLSAIEGGTIPNTELSLTGCRDSQGCHQLFTQYLGLLMKRMENENRQSKLAPSRW